MLERNSVAQQLRSLTSLVGQLWEEVGELRHENAELRQQVRELRGEVGYWKSMHALAIERNEKLQTELNKAQAEIRQLKAERFGKQSEKQSAADRSNDLDDPQQRATPKRKRGQQPGRPAPNAETIPTCQRARCRSTCLRMPRSVMAVESSGRSHLFLAAELVGRSPSRAMRFDQQRGIPRCILTHFAVLLTTQRTPRRLKRTNQCHPFARDAAPSLPPLRRMFTRRKGPNLRDKYGSDLAVTLDVDGLFRKTDFFQLKATKAFSAQLTRNQLDAAGVGWVKDRAFELIVDKARGQARFESVCLCLRQFASHQQKKKNLIAAHGQLCRRGYLIG